MDVSLKTKVNLEDVSINPLDPKMDRAGFSCGNDTIDNFFKFNAKKQHQSHQARVYIAAYNGLPIGYYYLVVKSSLPDEVGGPAERKFERAGSVPTIYLGMIGVSSQYQRQGLGKLLMLDAMKQTLKVSDLVGVYALTLDALNENVAELYEKWSFKRFIEGELSMYIAIPTIVELFKKK